MRPDRPATEDLNRGADVALSLADDLSDRDFFHR